MNWKTQIKADCEEIRNYNLLGLRGTQDDENYKVGDYARCSKDWDFENDCSSENNLGGTSAISINVMELENADDLIEQIAEKLQDVAQYNCKQIILLGGYQGDWGDDESEIVIADAKVLAIIED